MKLTHKSEWFEFPSPIGEPDVKWDEFCWDNKYENRIPNTYSIERTEDRDGKIVWMGYHTNWVKNPGKVWVYLGTDETVEMIPEYFNEKGERCGGYYPEGRSIWITCDPPIYEVMYQREMY